MYYMVGYTTYCTSNATSMEAHENQVEVTLRHGDTLNFTYKTSLSKAAQIIAFLSMGDTETSSHASGLPQNAMLKPARAAAAGSAIEAIRQSGSKTYPQKIVALGRFVVQRGNQETFDSKEVLALLRRMGDLPKNFGRDLGNAELLGYITREQNGEYLITDLGNEAVDSQFADAPAGISRKKRSSKKRSTAVED